MKSKLWFIGAVGFYTLIWLKVWAFSHKAPSDEPISQPGAARTVWPKAEWRAHANREFARSKILSRAPSDAKTFCPQGMNLNNWTELLGSMAKWESGFDPNQVYRESFGVNSIGLLQLSVSDKAYGCDFKTEADVKDPLKNISCAVRIMEKWTLKDGVISTPANKGSARYWAVLRSPKLSKTKTTLKPFCGE